MTKKAESKEVSDWKSALAADAKKTVEGEASDSNFISFQGGNMSMGDDRLPSNELPCIVVAHIHERVFYDRPYDPDDISPPDCFAQAIDKGDLIPHENVENPISTSCDGCPNAEFGSAKVGKGPACKTYRKLALIPVDADLDKPKMAVAKVSPTSVKNFSNYVKRVAAKTGLPPWGMQTLMSIVPDKKTQFKIEFEPLDKLGEDALPKIFSMIDAAEKMLLTPYTYDKDEQVDGASNSKKY